MSITALSLLLAATAAAPEKPVRAPAISPALSEIVGNLKEFRASTEQLNLLRAFAGDRANPRSIRTAADIALARDLFSAGKAKQGQAAFGTLIKKHKTIEDFLRLDLGRQLVKNGLPKEAIKALNPVDNRRWRGSRQRNARQLLMRAQHLAGNAKAAQRAAKRFRKLCRTCLAGTRPELLLLEARIALAAGERQKSKQLLMRVADRHSDSAASAPAGLLLQKHFSGTPMTLERKLAGIRALAARKGDRWSVDQLRALATRYAERPRLLFEVQLHLGRQLRRVDPLEGAALLDRLAAQAADDPTRLGRVQGARRIVLPRVGRMVETAALYFDQAHRATTSRAADERLFYAAWSLFGAGQYADAAATFDWLAEHRSLNTEQRRLARWFGPWCQLRSGAYEKATERLLKVAKKNASLAPKATFWAGRAEIARGNTQRGMELLQEVRNRWPRSLYGMRVASLPGAATRLRNPSKNTHGNKLRRFRMAVFANLGEGDWTRGESLRGGLPTNAKTATAWGQALQAAGAHHAAFLVAHYGLRYVRGLPGENARALWEVAYPRPWYARCVDCADVDRLPVAMVYSIMREESQFRPAVLSPAEAVGLMQLIPPTARLIANRLTERKIDPEALDDPAQNIALGTWYLAALASRYDHQYPLVMAAYNAGPAAADGWIRRAESLNMDMDTFMEEIPYRETRHYVYRVSRSLAVYRMLYGTETGVFIPLVQGLVQAQISGDVTF
jgi:soluble lytic murein transglycosylase